MVKNINQLKKENEITVPHSVLKEYQSKFAIREVLGCLIKNPQLLRTYKLNTDDFVDVFHQIIFLTIHNKARDGIQRLDAVDIENYLEESFPNKSVIFKKHNGLKYCQDIATIAIPENFEANYNEIKKWSLLRGLVLAGIDVSEFYDPNLEEPNLIEYKSELFKESSVEDILRHYRSKLAKLNDIFNPRNIKNSVRAGSLESKLQKDNWKENPSIGLSYASNFLTTITLGLRPGRYTVMSAGTGVGKTRISVANLCHTFAPKFYDKKKGEWVDNPNGTQSSALYIGTEMELIEEIEPIIWAYMADVPEKHITQNMYEPGEEERVDEAWRILHEANEKTGIFMEYVPEYDVNTLEEIIEFHKVEHNITAVFFDYIHTTTNLLSEYQGAAKGRITIREDQILGNLSAKLKEICRKHNISLDTWTQVTGNFKDDRVRDQTIVRGSKAIIDKCDVAGIVSRPTAKEKKLVEKYYRQVKKLRQDIAMPNVCLTIYKNRGGEENEIKIWLYIDYSTMRVHDLFVTNNDYEMLGDIKKTCVCIDEDKNIHSFTEVSDLEKFLKEEAKRKMSAIPDEELSDEEQAKFEEIIKQNKEQAKIKPVDDMFTVLDDFDEGEENNKLLNNSDINNEENKEDDGEDDDFNW